MFTSDPSTGGLTSNFAWQSLLIPYIKDDTETLEKYETLYGFTEHDDEELASFIYNYRRFLQNKVFGGAFKNYTASDLVMGYENDVAAKANGGDYLLGDDFNLINATTPLMND